MKLRLFHNQLKSLFVTLNKGSPVITCHLWLGVNIGWMDGWLNKGLEI